MSYPSIKIAMLVLITTILTIGTAAAQQDAPPASRQRADFAARPDSAAAHPLRLSARAAVSSPLIRLRDIAQPIGTASSWWDRTGSLVVGLMPLDGGEMVIELARLAEALAADPAVPPLEWTGPDRVCVRMVRSDEHQETTAEERQARIRAVAAVGAANPRAAGATVTAGYSPRAPAEAASDDVAMRAAAMPQLSAQEAGRLVQLVQFAIDRHDLSLRESYDIEIDTDQLPLRALADLRRVDGVEFSDQRGEGMPREPKLREGIVDVVVRGATADGDIRAPIGVRFTARPLVVVPRESLRRGHVITSSDVTLQPAPRGVAIHSVFASIEDVVEMQVQSMVQKDRPIPITSLSRPILIERGDLVEVQIVGGGVTVTTRVRSLGRGAAGDLIGVETLEPRKKLMARVTRAGLVEIATRPPRVQ